MAVVTAELEMTLEDEGRRHMVGVLQRAFYFLGLEQVGFPKYGGASAHRESPRLLINSM